MPYEHQSAYKTTFSYDVILFTFFSHLGTLRLVSPALHTLTTNADKNTATIMMTRLKQ